MFKKSFEFGYEYEDVDEEGRYFVEAQWLYQVVSHLAIETKEAVLSTQGPFVSL